MSTDPFADPASPAAIEYPDLAGSLLMVEVLSYEDHVPTVYTKPGERNPAIRANVTVIDGREAGRIYEDALIFPKLLQGQLRSRIGRTVLGRLVQGEAKAGQSPPWKLNPATDADKSTARGALARTTVGQTAAPSMGGTAAPPPQQQLPEPPF